MKKTIISLVLIVLIFTSMSITSEAAGKYRKPRPELDYTERSPYQGLLLDSLRDDNEEAITVYDDNGNVISLDYIDIVNQNNNY